MKPPKGADVGTRYGALTVHSVLSAGRKARVRFTCDCGALHDALLNVVKSAAAKGNQPRCKACVSEFKAENGLRRFDPTRYMQKRFGRLLVTGVSIDPARNKTKTRLVCLCDCGSQAIVTAAHLTTGKTTSCGCFHAERQVEVGKENIVHGHTANGVLNGHTPLYRAWMKIRAGCAEGWRKGFHLVCHEYDPRWDDYQEFLRDFGEIGPSHTISRKDNQMPWDKANCYVNLGRRNLHAVSATQPAPSEE